MTTTTEYYKEALGKLKKQLVASRFLRWWLGELSTFVPKWMRPPAFDAERFLTVPLGEVDAHWTPPDEIGQRELALLLPPTGVLSKALTLPLATEENLRQVLEFQLEQHTPFSSNQVYFGYAVSGRDFDKGRLFVDLVVTPKTAVDAAIKTIEERGGSVRAVLSQDMWERGFFVNLLPRAIGNAPSAVMQGANPWLLVLLLLLAFSAMVMPLLIKREAVLQMLPWVEKGKRAAEAVDGMRRELDARIDQHNYLLEKRQATPTVIQVLEELTRILPDDTWVQTFDIKGKELQIQGETSSSTRLIGLFEQSSIFKEASFRSPLTKGLVSGSEHFQLAIQIKPVVEMPVLPVPASSAQTAASSPSQPASVAASPPVQRPSDPASAPLPGAIKP